MPSKNDLSPGSTRYQEREWLRARGAEFWEDVFDRIACGVSPKAIAEGYGIRYAILARVIGESEERQTEYEAALQIAADGYAHEVVGIADAQPVKLGDGTVVWPDVPRDKLKIDARRWAASKWHRGRYGDSVTVEQVKRVVLDLKFGGPKELQQIEDARVVEGEAPRLAERVLESGDDAGAGASQFFQRGQE